MQSLNKKMDKQNGDSNVEQNHHDYQNRVGALLSEKEKGERLVFVYTVWISLKINSYYVVLVHDSLKKLCKSGKSANMAKNLF